MERLSQEQLRFVQENRAKRVVRRAPVTIGKVAAEYLQSGPAVGPAWKRQLLSVIAEHAAPLLQHATIAGVRNGVLRLHVAEPALMYSLRMTWEQRLLSKLRTELPDSGIHTLRFTTGANPE